MLTHLSLGSVCLQCTGEAAPSVKPHPSTTKQTVSAPEDDLEARLASLTLGGGAVGDGGAIVKSPQKVSDDKEHGFRTVEPSHLTKEKDERYKQSTKKQAPLPA